MADSYTKAKGGKLKLKGKKDKSHKKHKKHKREREEDAADPGSEDTLRHGGWWEVEQIGDICGGVALEVKPMVYMQASDNGLLKVGDSHDIGSGPDPEEILTAIKINDTKIALKSGFDKYLSVRTDGIVVGRSDAIATREQWEPVFQDGKMGLLGCNNCFLSAEPEGQIVCTDRTAEEKHMHQMRSCAKREKKLKGDVPDFEKGKVKDMELHYVKQFQSFEDRRIKINPNERTEIKLARKEGNLHETLLDRREKMKADRYCK